MVLFYYFLVLTIFGFAITGYDKYLAKKHKRRIPEKTLLGVVAFGGTIGAGVGMLVFRHKTSKKKYLFSFWGLVLFQILLVGAVCFYRLH
ncbi:DUF1294 domain-containing protein [Flavobacterium crassostreae]|nr:DUF1294 domain-containing protein [Flavobacterium crassostreae]